MNHKVNLIRYWMIFFILMLASSICGLITGFDSELDVMCGEFIAIVALTVCEITEWRLEKREEKQRRWRS